MELYQKLIAYVKAHYPWCRTVSAIELKALQLHASRVSENPSLDGYSQFHPKIVVHEKTNEQEEKHMSASQNHINRMRELIEQLRAADVAYYRDDNPTMTDRDYDRLTDELKALETSTGLILSGSPTQTVSGEILEELMPVRHSKPMLSADKTKSVDDLIRFAGEHAVMVSWKMDGLTLVLRYGQGKLQQAITRGREGIIGEDVTHTVRTFLNVPLTVPTTEPFEVRGEGVISWANFEKINLSL